MPPAVQSLVFSKPCCNATFSKKASRIPLAFTSLFSLCVQHLARSAGALTPARVCSVLRSTLRVL